MNNSIDNQYNSPASTNLTRVSNTGITVPEYKTVTFYDFAQDRNITIRKPVIRDEFEFVQTENETEQRKNSKQIRQLKRHRQILKQRVAAFAAAVSIAAGGIMLGKTNNDISNMEIIKEETSDEQEIITGSAEEVLETEIITPTAEAELAYEYLNMAIENFSSDMGIDGLELIKQRVASIGEGEIDTVDILKILFIESIGNVYGDDGEILRSYTGEAFGPFQLTPDTVDYLNYYYGFEGTEDELDVMNPYDNLDACIYNVKFLKQKKEKELLENGIFATGNDNLMEAVFWGYHDGAWAESVSEQGQNYIQKYNELSAIDDYPELIADLLSGNSN